MRTNIDIDDELMAKAMKASGALTKKAVVAQGLEMLVKAQAQTSIRKLRGKVQFYEDVLEENRAAGLSRRS